MEYRELLELAAKAAGHEWRWYGAPLGPLFQIKTHNGIWIFWDPLSNDGDALRLAVKLRIDFTWQPAMESVIAYPTMHDTLEITEEYMEYSDNGIPVDTYRYSALRRAIVRAAAEIGKQMA